jgi:hypothetical protein
MPRRTRPRRSRGRRDDEPPALAPAEVLVGAPPGWQARGVRAQGAVKEYRCPGCNHEIRLGTAHVVAWRHADEEHRRHWHRGCWQTHLRATGARERS